MSNIEQLLSKHVAIDDLSMAGNETTVRPFDIGLGVRDVIHIWGVRVVVHSSTGGAVFALFQWGLIQKNERFADRVNSGTLDEDFEDPSVIGDHDLLAVGQFILAEAGNDEFVGRQSTGPDMLWFPKPIVIPRSPSMIFRNHVTSGSPTYRAVFASLYYEKKQASVNEVRLLLKKWYGRKQDVVSNIPRIIDE